MGLELPHRTVQLESFIKLLSGKKLKIHLIIQVIENIMNMDLFQFKYFLVWSDLKRNHKPTTKTFRLPMTLKESYL